jgi:alpha-beta hydrolase superfamily lysophospholipase
MRACIAWLVMGALGGASPAHAGLDSLAGHWAGAYGRLGSVQLVQLDLVVRGDSVSGTYDIPELGIEREPLRGLDGDLSGFTLRLTYGAFAMRVSPARDELTGINERWNPPVTLHLKRAPAQLRPRALLRDVSFRTGDVTLAGTLTMPSGPGPHPAIVVIHGSGEQGRASGPYQSWGAFFAQRGIAALTYDKRGTGGSSGDFTRATFDDLAEDVRSAVRAIEAQPDLDGAKIGLFGISQGGWLAPLAALDGPGVAFIIMNVGPSVSVREQELHRVEYSMRADEAPEPGIAAALAYTRRVFDAAYTGRGKRALFALADSVRRASWGEYVQPVTGEPDLDDWRRIRYDPARTLSRTRAPLLALFGENDVLVPPAENAAKLRRLLEQAGHRDFTIQVIPGANHDMETFGTLRGDTWNWPEAHWVWARKAPGYYAAITAWLGARGLGSGPTLESGITQPGRKP